MLWELPYLPVTRVEVELTEACNLSCSFCYNSCAPRQSSQVEDILHRLHEAGVMEIILTGGEPGLAENFAATLKLASTLFSRVMLQSNGTLFSTNEQFAVLRSIPIFCLNFSLHGPQEIHDALTRTQGSCNATLAALQLAAQAEIRTASNLVLTAHNASVDILEQTVDLLQQTNCKEMTVTRFIPTGQGRLEPLSLTNVRFWECLRFLTEATKARGISLLLANAVPACEMPVDLRHLCNRCSFGFDKFYVDVEGNVLLCGMSRKVLGNLLGSTLKDVLAQSPIYKQYRTLRHIPLRCQECDLLELCGGGCRAAALATTGDIAGQDSLLTRSL